mmetsp:Transcript_28005/g.73447  ORF Transcript_28005/g.73447 Transcript_28005/m.73447 type:complete len:314 (-) Transcript_28005:34-975(-)
MRSAGDCGPGGTTAMADVARPVAATERTREPFGGAVRLPLLGALGCGGVAFDSAPPLLRRSADELWSSRGLGLGNRLAACREGTSRAAPGPSSDPRPRFVGLVGLRLVGGGVTPSIGLGIRDGLLMRAWRSGDAPPRRPDPSDDLREGDVVLTDVSRDSGLMDDHDSSSRGLCCGVFFGVTPLRAHGDELTARTLMGDADESCGESGARASPPLVSPSCTSSFSRRLMLCSESWRAPSIREPRGDPWAAASPLSFPETCRSTVFISMDSRFCSPGTSYLIFFVRFPLRLFEICRSTSSITSGENPLVAPRVAR